jgi:two-component system, NarL family, response regulator DesR
MRILLADDSDLIIERLSEMLKMYGQAEIVGSFKNGKDAFEALKALRPDLAILDMKMPGMSGLEVVTEIRKEDKDLKIIIITFYTSDRYRELAFKAGADYFFNKVDDFDEVSMVIAGILWKRAIIRKLKS